MNKSEIWIPTKIKNGVVAQLSKSVITQPSIKFKGGTVKWVDDSKLIRKK